MANQQSPSGTSATPPSVPQKRVLPARERRQSAAKREASSPGLVARPSSAKKSTPSKGTPKTTLNRASKRKLLQEATPPPRASTPIVEEPLPAKITDAKPLPTSHQPQTARISIRHYQNIAESAVLAASLHRSRIKWLAEGVFERYWIKPSKKKGAEAVANNPDLKSMQKLGSSTVVLGPHTFDAIIYTVRDTAGCRHPNQYPPRPLSSPPPGFHPYQPVGAPPTHSHGQPPVGQGLPAARVEVKEEQNPVGRVEDPQIIVRKVPEQLEVQSSNEASAAQPAPAPSGPDPVIRLLATRAATNPDLKALMKIVASSQATQDQLKVFQGHIDELNVMIRQEQDTDRTPPGPSGSQVKEELRVHAQTEGPSDDPVGLVPRGGESTGTSIARNQHSTPPLQPQHRSAAVINHLEPPVHAPPHQRCPPPQQKLPIPEPVIKAIILEFTTPASAIVPASQDRYLFPEHAVLDTVHGRHGLEMICSFLVTRKGSDLLALHAADGTASSSSIGGLTRWKATEEYYQPVTMKMKTSQPRIFETIARAAKPLQEVQTRMKETMESKTRIKDEWLVLRLPREKGMAIEAPPGRDAGFVDSAVEMEDDKAGSGNEDDELKNLYGF